MSSHAVILAQARALAPLLAEAHKLAVLSSCTLDFLRPYVVVRSEEVGVLLDPWFGPFDQFEQMVLDDGSPLWQTRPRVLWIHLRIEDADPGLYDQTRADDAGAGVRLEQIRQRVVALATAARPRFEGPILVSNFTIDDFAGVDPFDASNPDGLMHRVAETNRLLASALRAVPDAYVFDYARCVAWIGASRFRDERLWHMARAPVAAPALADLAAALVRTATGVLRPPAKCIVVDLDHTLWGGVLGDDGIEGIALGETYPGNAYRRFQRALSGLRDRGFLLAVCSKNDEQTVRDALASHPEMILRPADFAAIRANWEPKPENLRRIAADLNLGLDALVFLDDNPVERAAVRSELPEVQVIDLPPEPHGYVAALRRIEALDRVRVEKEDRERAAMYAVDSARQHAAVTAPSLGEYLAGLEMVAEIGHADDGTLPRVHQLIGKTNQFNLTTRRHSLEHVRRLATAPSSAVLWLRLADRFGDLGLVAVAAIRRLEASEGWLIDTFLMSCRVMGRGVEAAALSALAEVARERGAHSLIGEYCPTVKNHIVKGFYLDHGFAPADVRGAEGSAYRIALGEPDVLPWPSTIRRGPIERR